MTPMVVDSSLLIRDLRHMDARAASDLADWLVHLELEGKADRTLYAYNRALAPLLRSHPEKTLSEFTHTDVNEELRLLPERSRYISRSIYNVFFDWAEDDERIERSPMNRVPKMRQSKRRPKDIFSVEEVALLEALPMPDGPLFTLLFWTGIRRKEARELRRDRIDLNRARLIVYDGKGGKNRIVPLPPHVLSAVADLDLVEGLGAKDYVWYSRPGGGRRKSRRAPIGDTTFEHWYYRCLDAAEIHYVKQTPEDPGRGNPHTTRHTYGHMLREQGFDLEERQLLMGHEDIATTQKYYGHLTIEDVARKVAAL